ncbi:MAG: RDD family protein [Reyranellales bacterium]
MATAPPPPDWANRQQIAAADIGPAAGFWIRFVAYMIDSLILGVAAGIIIGIVVGIAVLSGGSNNEDRNLVTVIVGAVIGVALMIVIGWLYEALLTSSPKGATLGKQAVGVRIVRADGTQLSFGRATARYFLKAMITPMVPFAIGYLLAAFTAGKRALHDFMADTLVIKSR